jgi:hypothetical protein
VKFFIEVLNGSEVVKGAKFRIVDSDGNVITANDGSCVFTARKVVPFGDVGKCVEVEEME